MVRADEDYSVYMGDPDILVDWKFIEQIVRYLSAVDLKYGRINNSRICCVFFSVFLHLNLLTVQYVYVIPQLPKLPVADIFTVGRVFCII